jgi:hypothetical protein
MKRVVRGLREKPGIHASYFMHHGPDLSFTARAFACSESSTVEKRRRSMCFCMRCRASKVCYFVIIVTRKTEISMNVLRGMHREGSQPPIGANFS